MSLSRNKAEPGNPLVPRYWLAVSSATLAQSGSNWICRPTIQFGDHIAHQRQRRCRRQRLERHGFEQAAQRGLELHQPRGALGRRLAPHDQPAGGDRRHDLVEHGRALARMPAAHGDLHDIGDVPDQLVPFRQFLDDLADAAFELADIDLIGLQIGAAGFEDAPVVGCQPLRQQPQERRLADQAARRRPTASAADPGAAWTRQAQAPRASRPARPASRCRVGSTRTGRPRSMSCKTWPVQLAPTASGNASSSRMSGATNGCVICCRNFRIVSCGDTPDCSNVGPNVASSPCAAQRTK